MNTDNMSKEELRNYILSLLNRMNEDQLRTAIIYLQEVIKIQEGEEDAG